MLKKMITFCSVAAVSALVMSTSAQADEAAKGADKTAAKQAVQPEKKKPTKEELYAPATKQKLSEQYGHFIFKSLDNPIVKLDVDAIIKGMQDAKAGKAAPMADQEYEEKIMLLQEYAFEDAAAKNLKEAEAFLKENAKKADVKILEPEKLQYTLMQEGKGEVVTENTIPTIKYSGKCLDGTSLGSSEQNGGTIALPLKQTIPGFKKGVMGMKVGEKRKLFIHPDLGYGKSGQLPPNSLLIFEIEVVDVKPEPVKTETKPAAPAKDEKAAKPEAQDKGHIAAETLYPDQMEEGDDAEEEISPDEGDDEEGDKTPAKEAPKK